MQIKRGRWGWGMVVWPLTASSATATKQEEDVEKFLRKQQEENTAGSHWSRSSRWVIIFTSPPVQQLFTLENIYILPLLWLRDFFSVLVFGFQIKILFYLYEHRHLKFSCSRLSSSFRSLQNTIIHCFALITSSHTTPISPPLPLFSLHIHHHSHDYHQTLSNFIQHHHKLSYILKYYQIILI